MSSKPFRIDQLFGGFCPPSQEVEDSDDEHTSDPYGEEAKLSPAITTPAVRSTSNETMDPQDKASKKSRRRILPAPNTTESPVAKKDVLPLAETLSLAVGTEVTPTADTGKKLSETEIAPSSATAIEDTSKQGTKIEASGTEIASSLDAVLEGPPASNSEKQKPETEIVDSSKATKGNASSGPTNNDSGTTSEAISCESVPIIPLNEKEIGEKEEEATRSNATTMFFPLVLIACAFALYFSANFNRADIQSISFDSMLRLGDSEAITTNSRLNSMIAEDKLEPVSEKASASVVYPPKEESNSQDEIDPEHRNIDEVDESVLAESEHDDVRSTASSTESPPIDLEYNEESAEGAEGTLMSSSLEHGVNVDAVVEQVVEGEAMNSDLDYQEQVDTNVERDAEPEDSESHPQVQTATSTKRDIESSADLVHEKQADTNNESANVLGVADMKPEHGDQADANDDGEPDEKSETNFDHDAVDRDLVSHLDHEKEADTTVKPDSHSNLDNSERADISAESDSETEVGRSNSEHHFQVDPEAGIENVETDAEQTEDFTEPEAEIQNIDSDLVYGEDTERSAESKNARVGNDDSSGIQDTESNIVGSIPIENHHSTETVKSDTLESAESYGVEEDSEFESHEVKSILNEENLTHPSSSSLMADGQDEGTDATDENDESSVLEELLESDSGDMEELQGIEESIVTASDYREKTHCDDLNQNGHVDVEQETGSTTDHSEHTNTVGAEVQSTDPGNNAMRFLKLRSDELGPYLVTCEAVLEENTINTSPKFVCSE